MDLRKKVVTTGLTASLLASLIATTFAGTALAATTATVPANTVGDFSATAVSLGQVSFPAGSTDISTTGLLVATLPAGYSWATAGTITTTETGTGFVVADGTMAGGSTVTFAVTAVPTVTTGASLAFSGASVQGSGGAVSGNVVLTFGGTWTGGSLSVATVSTGFLNGPYGTAIPYRTNVTTRPADGVSFIDLEFQTTTSHAITTASVSGGTFIGGSGAFAAKTGTSISLVPGAIAAGSHLFLASTTAGTANVTVAYSDGTATTDSITPFTFTTPAQGNSGGQGGRDHDRGKGHGARKVGFYQNPTWSCATGGQPVTGAETFGFAILNTTGHKTLNVNVVLKGAAPNVAYDVFVYQEPGACSPTKQGTLTTDTSGNGHGHFRLPIVSGAKHYSVTAVGSGGVFATFAASLTVKGK